MTPGLWLLTLLTAALALASVLLLGRSLPRISLPGIAGELLSLILIVALFLLGAPLYALLIVLGAGAVGTALTLARLLSRPDVGSPPP